MSLGQLLRRLDEAVLDHTYSAVWLVAASAIGLALAVVGGWGLVRGGGPGTTADPFAVGTVLFVLPLVELWRRRRIAAGGRRH